MGQASGKPLVTLVEQAESRTWAVLQGESLEGDQISIFEHVFAVSAADIEKSPSADSSPARKSLQNAITQLKKLRHPAIVKYQWDQIEPERISIITDAVSPLEIYTEAREHNEIALGLFSLAKGLHFLHTNKVAHGNIHIGNVFISHSDNSWQLGNFEVAGTASTHTHEEISATSFLRSERSTAPEDANPNIDIDAYARDMYAFGNLISDCFQASPETSPALDKFLKRVQARLTVADPNSRMTSSELMKDVFFSQNKLIKVRAFLSEFTLQTSVQKRRFFKSLPNDLKNLSAGTIVRHLLNPLMSKVIFVAEEVQDFMRKLLIPKTASSNGILPFDDYIASIVPRIVDLLSSRERIVRLAILDFTSAFVDSIPSDVFKSEVLPEVVEGLNDDSDEIVLATLDAMKVITKSESHQNVCLFSGGERREAFVGSSKIRTEPVTAMPIDFNNLSDPAPSQHDDESVDTGTDDEIINDGDKVEDNNNDNINKVEEASNFQDSEDESDWGEDDWNTAKPTAIRKPSKPDTPPPVQNFSDPDSPPIQASRNDDIKTKTGTSNDWNDDAGWGSDNNDESDVDLTDLSDSAGSKAIDTKKKVTPPRKKITPPRKKVTPERVKVETASIDENTTRADVQVDSPSVKKKTRPLIAKKKGLSLSGKAKVIKKAATDETTDKPNVSEDKPKVDPKPKETTPKEPTPEPEPDFFADMAPPTPAVEETSSSSKTNSGDKPVGSPSGGRLDALAIDVDDADDAGWDDGEDDNAWGSD